MPYSELVKNFGRIRDYLREFYVYGFKSREEYTQKSARSYDDERRRVESWLGDYMRFGKTAEGKSVFLSIDSRVSQRNPLYQAWKAKSFTDGDITLHFYLMDILYEPGTALSLSEIMDELDRRLAGFQQPRLFDESTVRKKLKEYEREGIAVSERRGRVLYFRRADGKAWEELVGRGVWDCLEFFSEAAPCGVIGSYLLDRKETESGQGNGRRRQNGSRQGNGSGRQNGRQGNGCFAFKHHYITGAMDSEIVCLLLQAMREKRFVALETARGFHGRETVPEAVPLQLRFGVQSGRQYLMAYVPGKRRVRSFRTDNLGTVKLGENCGQFDEYRKIFQGMLPHIWGVSTQGRSGQRLEHVEFTVAYGFHEQHIHWRLVRERQCGTVEQLDEHTSRFQADVYDASELVPWIRTFLCRIVDIHFSDKKLEEQFGKDLEQMYQMYGLGPEEGEKR